MPVQAFATGSPNLEGATQPPAMVRVIFDFALAPDAAEELLASSSLTPEQERLFRAALRSAAAWRRICHMALVSQLEADPSGWSEQLFKGPGYDQILDCVLPYLSPADHAYWTELRNTEPEALIFYLDPIFQEIRGELVSVRIIDVDTGEAVPAVFARQDA